MRLLKHRWFKNRSNKEPSAESQVTATEPATVDSISEKLKSYTVTQGRASFQGASPYAVEELYQHPSETLTTTKSPPTPIANEPAI
ncbi:hypothetical protein A9Q81_21650 [Gammaproteobacteria bacterium 42_54_T18]|nr:hypothetical protein A9Q81_21650 [Gammaproteobacteria bacterium 42_54_T18]